MESYKFEKQYDFNSIFIISVNLYGQDDNFNLETSPVLPALIRKMHLAKCLENNDWDSIRKDLDKRPIENIDGKSSLEDILKILSKYGIEISRRVTPSSTEINYTNKDSVNSVSSVVNKKNISVNSCNSWTNKETKRLRSSRYNTQSLNIQHKMNRPFIQRST
ncbi:MAG: NAD-dependent epimerase/dehydratase family protein [Candidatus Marinimicrobia bacterium]|nr:NAD-dependent epimerase/dehydratase family protein [Candidatus Neomarinimicrobiota bacterium]